MRGWWLSCLLLPCTAFAQDDWQLSVVPYIWGASVKADVNAPPLAPITVHKSFSDTFQHLDMAAMAIIDARRGRWGILSDFTWVDTSEDAMVPRVGLPATLETRVATAALMGHYRFIDEARWGLDAIAGARYWHLRGKVDVPALGRGVDISRNWVDPVLGVRLGWTLSGRQGITVWALGSASDAVRWDLMASYGVRITDHAWLRVGYRYLAMRQVTRYLDFDGAMAGPGLGLEWRF
ncbi:hypothetical protein [uncultured Stenotrophomonas sp.]|uniref:hypothetical protein n=1 Tax=uncultured Stenotrophomonas sp. TaxID=165438 RepID=UPI0028E9CBC1|nr:hypothetical protein [uncultured Stenotrophomonas sp.]